MQLKELIVLILSSLLYSLSFLFIDYAWPLIFLFFFPFLYAVYARPISIAHGFMWGFFLALFNGIGWIPVFLLLIHDNYLIVGFIVISLAVYIGLFAGILFWMTSRLIDTFFAHSFASVHILFWTVAMMIFIEWIDHYCLIVGGELEGFPLLHPLLPLTHKPFLLGWLPYLGLYIMTFLLLSVSSSFFLLMHYKNKLFLVLTVFFLFFWMFSYYNFIFLIPTLSYSSIGTPIVECNKKCDIIKTLPLIMRFNDDEIAIKMVTSKLKEILSEYPKTEIIIMPESALTLSCLEKNLDLLQLWSEKHLNKAIHFIFGTTRCDNDKQYNSVYWIYNGEIKFCYDKSHAMLMTERLPKWLHNLLVRINIKQADFISKGRGNRPCLSLTPETDYVPYLCSEFFFNTIGRNHNNNAIVLLVNDVLFSSSYSRYIQRLLLAVAQLRAIEYEREIIYASYAYSCIITKQGMLKDLDSL
jgi:apolipoprotein N-acyltransferase